MAMAMASSTGERRINARMEKRKSNHALEQQRHLGHVAAMQRNGRKLANVFDGVVPGEAIVHIGNDTQVHAVRASLLQNVLNDAALTGGSEEDLIHKLLAGVLEERIESANHIAGSCAKSGNRNPEVR